MTRTLVTTLAAACMLLAPLPFAHADHDLRCNEERKEAVGFGDDGVGTYQYHEPQYGSEPEPFCEWYPGQDLDCERTFFGPYTTPSELVVEEVRVLGQVIVPETPIPLPSETVPAIVGPEPYGCYYGVYYDLAPAGETYALRGEIGTDGCRYDYNPTYRPAQDAVCEVYYLVP